MASVFGHALVAITIKKIADDKNTKWLLLSAILSSILPDLDVISFNLGIPYLHPLGHRGFSHSILFALIWAGILAISIGKLKKKLWFFVIFLSTLSHGVLDAMTNGGKGIGFFIPFENSRYFFPFRPIQVSPIGIEKFFSQWGLEVILSEIKYVLLPSIVIFVILKMVNKYKSCK